MTEGRPSVVRPGKFGVEASADVRRSAFDYHNEALLAREVPIDTVFIGDSITDWWAVDAYFRGTSGGAVVNRGIGGDRSEFVLRRFDADALQLLPRLIILLIGVNNTWDIDEPWDLDIFHTPEHIEELVSADVDAMAQAAGERGIRLALCSILPTRITTSATTPVRNELIVRINHRLHDVARHRDAVWVDYHARMTDADGLTLRADLADDGLHPHVRGYDVMAATLLETLAAADLDVLGPNSG